MFFKKQFLLTISSLIHSSQFFRKLRLSILKNPLMVKFLPKYFSLNGIDFKLEKYLDYSNGYFVELGANDGVRQSNTKYFEQFRKWTGTLIENAIKL